VKGSYWRAEGAVHAAVVDSVVIPAPSELKTKSPTL
jgi:hypothetical protein